MKIIIIIIITPQSHSEIVTESLIFHHFDHLQHTVTGFDEVPPMVSPSYCPCYSSVLTHHINFFSQSHVPTQWKTLIIVPIPKIASPSSPADFCPIAAEKAEHLLKRISFKSRK